MLNVTNISKRYGKINALDGITFRVPKGKVCGILGAPGSGKTTLMNVITGCISATSGTVEIDGIDIRKHPREAKRYLGYMPANPPVYSDMTVGEYLDFVLSLKRYPKKDRAGEKERVLKLGGFDERRLISSLLALDRKKLSLLQACLGSPKLIVLDEPASLLTPDQAREIRALIKEVAKEHTVILASKHLREATELCEDIIILNHKGNIVINSPIDKLSKDTSGLKRLRISLMADRSRAKVLFGNVAEIIDYDAVPEIEHGVSEFVVTYPATGQDIRPVLFKAAAELDMPIVEMRPINISIEDIFMQLSGSDTR